MNKFDIIGGSTLTPEYYMPIQDFTKEEWALYLKQRRKQKFKAFCIGSAYAVAASLAQCLVVYSMAKLVFMAWSN
jgi:hypothetical protein